MTRIKVLIFSGFGLIILSLLILCGCGSSGHSSTVVPATLSFTTTTLPSGTTGTVYNQNIQTTGGTLPITWSIPANTLPPGLAMQQGSNSQWCVVSGTPTTAGSYTFTVTATDSSSPARSASQTFTVVVSIPALVITTTSLPAGVVNTAYSQTLQASGGTSPYTWSAATGSSLPAWLSLSGSGTLSGTPTAVGSYTFTVAVRDASSPQKSVNQQFTIVINSTAQPLAIITTSLPGGVVNTAYSEPLEASGGTPPYSWSVATGSSLPAWLTLSGSGVNWTLSGTPTIAGTSTFSVKVTDSSTPTAQSKTQALSVTITGNAAACGAGKESVLSGQYAFSLSGYNSSGFLAAIGSFTADGSGHITAGTVDSNGALGVKSGSVTASGSSYSVGSDYRGCATIVTPFYTFTTRFALDPTAKAGNIEEWEPAPTPFIASGQILKQTIPTSLTAGVWVYEQIGVFGSSKERTAVVGTLTASGSGTYTAGEYDSNAQGTHHTYTGLTGTYTSPDATTGRFIAVTSLSGITAHRAEYLVSATQFLELTTDAASSITPILIGRGRLQSGSLTISGNLAYYAAGLEATGAGGVVELGRVTVTGTSTLTANVYEDIAGTWDTPNPAALSCSYGIDSYGKVTISGGNCGTYPPVVYLSGPNTGFILGTDSGVSVGDVQPQSAMSITAGTYYFGTSEIVDQDVQASAGVATITSSGVVSGVSDDTSTSSPQQGSQAVSDTVSVNSDGTFSTSKHPGMVSGIIFGSAANPQLVLINSQGSKYPSIIVIKTTPKG